MSCTPANALEPFKATRLCIFVTTAFRLRSRDELEIPRDRFHLASSVRQGSQSGDIPLFQYYGSQSLLNGSVQLAEQPCPEQFPNRNNKTYEYLVTEKVYVIGRTLTNRGTVSRVGVLQNLMMKTMNPTA
jgi:hypothetical protein